MFKKLHLLFFCVLFSSVIANESSLSVKDASVPAIPPGVKSAQVHLSIVNSSNDERALGGVSSDAAEAMEIHEMKMQDGRMMMRKIDALSVPANGERVLEHGSGYHLMLMGLKSSLEVGTTIKFTLTFKNGDVIHFDAPVIEAHHHH